MFDSSGDRRLSLSEAEDEPEDEDEESSAPSFVSTTLVVGAVAEWDVGLTFLLWRNLSLSELEAESDKSEGVDAAFRLRLLTIAPTVGVVAGLAVFATCLDTVATGFTFSSSSSASLSDVVDE